MKNFYFSILIFFFFSCGGGNNTLEVNPKPLFSSDIPDVVFIDENTIFVISISISNTNNDTLNYYLSGSDKDSLNISTNGQINFINPPNYELKNTYNIELLNYLENHNYANI